MSEQGNTDGKGDIPSVYVERAFLEYTVQFWQLYFKKDIDKLEWAQKKAARKKNVVWEMCLI